MKAKQFFKSLSWLLFLNLLIKPAWIFLIDRRVQNIVGHEEYGMYFALFNLTYVLLFIADAGLSNMLGQRLAANEKLDIKQLLSVKFCLLLLYVVICFGVAWATGVVQWSILGYLILIQSLTSFFIFLRTLLTARQLFKTDAFFSILDKSLLFVLCIGPVYGLFYPITMLLFLQLQTISLSVATVTLWLTLLHKSGLTAGNKIKISRLAAWVAPFVVIIFLMSMHNRLDAFLLERLHPRGAVQAGIYAMAYRLLDAGNMLGYLTATFLVPFLSRHKGDKMLIQNVVLFSRHGLLLFSAVVVSFVVQFSPWIQEVLYHTTDTYANIVLLLCVAALPAYYLTHIYGSALTATTFFRTFILIVFAAVLLNILLNLWLIPAYGAVGCCIAALCSQYACALSLWIAASKRLSIYASAATAFLYPAAAIIFGLLFWFGQTLTNNVWIILSSIALVVAGLLLAGRNLLKKMLLPFFK